MKKRSFLKRWIRDNVGIQFCDAFDDVLELCITHVRVYLCLVAHA
jgi:hypothetical protein